MDREQSMLKNTVILAVGKICTQFISFLLLPVYTAVLTTEEYGTVDLMNTYFSLLIPIVSLQIEQAVFRFLVEIRGEKEKQKQLISSVAAGTLMNMLLYLLVFFLIRPWIRLEFRNFLALNVVAGVLSGITLQIARGIGDNVAYAMGSFVSAVVTVLLNVYLVVVVGAGAAGMLLASLLGNLACAVYLAFRLRLYRYLSWHSVKRKKLKEYYRYSLPLIPNGISWWLVSASDRVVISGFLGTGANGIYSAANKFSSVYITIYNIVNLTWTESAALHINDSDRDVFFTRMVRSIYSIFFSICLLITAVMPFLFPLLINEKFGDAYEQIPILMLASLCNVVVGLYSVVYIARKETAKIARTSMGAAAINVVVDLFLINRVGIFAGSVSSLVAYGAMMLLRYFDVQKYVKMRLDKKTVISNCLVFVLVCWGYYCAEWQIQLVLLAAAIIYALIMNRKLLESGKEILLNFIHQYVRKP